jgi:hypothetical protein
MIIIHLYCNSTMHFCILHKEIDISRSISIPAIATSLVSCVVLVHFLVFQYFWQGNSRCKLDSQRILGPQNEPMFPQDLGESEQPIFEENRSLFYRMKNAANGILRINFSESHLYFSLQSMCFRMIISWLNVLVTKFYQPLISSE